MRPLSIRVRLTLWYTLILALVLLIFSSIVYETARNDLDAAVYANLRSRLTQVASTYNPQTGRHSRYHQRIAVRNIGNRKP